ncbi:MAG: transcriptional repressor [Peptococcaceae bacterium]|jgi:Fur family peroxide stress response transcriptional regulator|nr:transcriptional repressor [Peptococcaceae bacterium]
MSAIEILNQLKEKGIRFTPQRQAILEFLLSTDTHPTAEEIYHHVKKRFTGMSLGTIYNTVKMLKEHGYILELTYGDMSCRFDGNPENHYHITCQECGRVFDYQYSFPELEAEKTKDRGFKVTDYRLEFYGFCSECAESGKEAGQ